jgi:thiol:disulfide interchange protein/DsbC/DsbD-like thiol-disulfide interchange protein
MRRVFVLCAVLIAAAPGLGAADADPNHHPVKASLIAASKGFAPGQALTVALRLQQEPGWHTYWSDPGDAGLATSVEWSLPAGVKAGPLLWPQPLTFKDPGGLVGYGYKDEALLITEIRVPAGYSAGALPLKANANWLVCREVCIPGDAGVSLVLERLDPNPPSANAGLFNKLRPGLGLAPKGYTKAAAKGAPGVRVSDTQLDNFEKVAAKKTAAAGAGQAPETETAPPSTHSLAWLLLLGFAGGLLLNLMPCVLPVLSLKALSFVEQAGESRGQGLRLAGAFAAGVLASFWALAALVLALKQGGESVGWGFQFQEPGFVLFMAGLVLAFALNLFGVFEIWLPGGATEGLNKTSNSMGLAGAFGHGLVMTLLATPCSAPFLGTALGFAFVAPPAQLVAIFTAVAVGLALPFVLLASIPGAHAWLPRPGAWMLRFKEAMGFLLMATWVWLVWLLGKQVGTDALAAGMLWMLELSLAAWIWGNWGGIKYSLQHRLVLAAFLAALLGAGALWAWPVATRPDNLPERAAAGAGNWLAWDAAEVEKLRAQGRTVFVDFTADWCWTCKVNEKAVLQREDIQAAFAAGQVALMRADWTRRDTAITQALRGYGRSGVPAYVIYKGKAPAKLLPEVITAGLVMEGLK